jgi:hypothetical protein
VPADRRRAGVAWPLLFIIVAALVARRSLPTTDWQMPRVDGLALCKLLRHTHPIADLPVIPVPGLLKTIFSGKRVSCTMEPETMPVIRLSLAALP